MGSHIDRKTLRLFKISSMEGPYLSHFGMDRWHSLRLKHKEKDELIVIDVVETGKIMRAYLVKEKHNRIQLSPKEAKEILEHFKENQPLRFLINHFPE